MTPKIIPFLWFDSNAEEAANFYVSVFKNSKITNISYFPDSGQEVHGRPAGSVMVVAFELDGQPFHALNGGPHFKFTEAVSFEVPCADQEELDYYWERLTDGGDPSCQQCGWLRDKFGLSWQIVPADMGEIMNSTDAAASKRAFAAMMEMKKLDTAALQKAFQG